MRAAGPQGRGAAGATGASEPLVSNLRPPRSSAPLPCLRCGYPIRLVHPSGCRNPCPNCRTIYPLGDCSD